VAGTYPRRKGLSDHKWTALVDLLLQEAAIRLRQNLIVIRLERQPSFARQSNLLIAIRRFLVVNISLLVPAALRRCIDEKLCMASLVEAEEPEGCCVDCFADLGEQSAIWSRDPSLQDLQ
jgi:hypothetical protein